MYEYFKIWYGYVKIWYMNMLKYDIWIFKQLKNLKEAIIILYYSNYILAITSKKEEDIMIIFPRQIYHTSNDETIA